MKEILCANGEKAIVSDCDWLWLCPYAWSLSNSGYAKAWIDGKMQYMHLMIAEKINLDFQNQIDHEDRIKLNNQRHNLRQATRSQNAGNSSLRSDNTSGHKGVTWNENAGKWSASIFIHGKRKHLGYFVEKIEASAAYNIAAKSHFGDFANANPALHESNKPQDVGSQQGRVLREVSGGRSTAATSADDAYVGGLGI